MLLIGKRPHLNKKNSMTLDIISLCRFLCKMFAHFLYGVKNTMSKRPQPILSQPEGKMKHLVTVSIKRVLFYVTAEWGLYGRDNSYFHSVFT